MIECRRRTGRPCPRTTSIRSPISGRRAMTAPASRARTPTATATAPTPANVPGWRRYSTPATRAISPARRRRGRGSGPTLRHDVRRSRKIGERRDHGEHEQHPCRRVHEPDELDRTPLDDVAERLDQLGAPGVAGGHDERAVAERVVPRDRLGPLRLGVRARSDRCSARRGVRPIARRSRPRREDRRIVDARREQHDVGSTRVDGSSVLSQPNPSDPLRPMYRAAL